MNQLRKHTQHGCEKKRLGISCIIVNNSCKNTHKKKIQDLPSLFNHIHVHGTEGQFIMVWLILILILVHKNCSGYSIHHWFLSFSWNCLWIKSRLSQGLKQMTRIPANNNDPITILQMTNIINKNDQWIIYCHSAILSSYTVYSKTISVTTWH